MAHHSTSIRAHRWWGWCRGRIWILLFAASPLALHAQPAEVGVTDSTLRVESPIIYDDILPGRQTDFGHDLHLLAVHPPVIDSIDRHAHDLKMYPLEGVEPIAEDFRESGLRWFYSLHIPERYYPRLDSTYVPLIEYDFGFHRNPVMTAQAALSFYNAYLDSGAQIDSVIFMANVEWLVENHDDYYLRYQFDWRHGGRLLPNGWVSAMAQGEALAAVSAAFHLTRDSTYYEAATGFFRTLYANKDDTWAIVVDENRYYWLEEYPTIDWCHVLNGKLFGLWGLWSYFVISEDAFALELFRAGIQSVVDNVERWNVAGRNSSRYCLHGLQYAFYHETHVRQLNDYLTFFDIPEFAAAADRFQQYEAARLSHAAVHFGYVRAGTPSERKVTIYSEGTSELEVTNIDIDSPAFEPSVRSASIPAGDSAEVSLEFVGSEPGDYSARLSIATRATSHMLAWVEATAVPNGVYLDDRRLAFDQTLALHADTSLLVIANMTDHVISLDSVYVDTSAFRALAGPSEIPALATAELHVVFAPAVAGEYSGMIAVHSGEDRFEVEVSAQAVSPLRVLRLDGSETVDFGSVVPGETDTVAVSISNVGSVPLSGIEMGTTTAAFALVDTLETIDAATVLTIRIAFAPPVDGLYEDVLRIFSPVTHEPLTLELRGQTSADLAAQDDHRAGTVLIAVYPNPATSTAVIEYELAAPALVRIDLYDILGRTIQTLVDRARPHGTHKETVDVSALPAGTYLYRMVAGDVRQTGHMLIVR